MKVVLLTAHSPNGEPQHRYVAHQVAAAFPDELIAIVVATGMRRSFRKRLSAILERYSAAQIVARLALRARHAINTTARNRERTFNALFFPDGDGQTMPRTDILHEVPVHNGARCKALLDELQPDVILTYGTLIIRPDVIAKAKISMINMHTGLSPTYRGSDTIFWPLHNAEPQFVGVTVHRVDPGIDSGEILHRAKPQIAPDDNEHTLFAKAVMAGTPLLIAAAREEHEGRSKPIRQDLTEGREYRSVQRTVGAERRVERHLKNGLLRNFVDRAKEGGHA